VVKSVPVVRSGNELANNKTTWAAQEDEMILTLNVLTRATLLNEQVQELKIAHEASCMV
jgi:hypothetical protein